jgi:hypothetical protein
LKAPVKEFLLDEIDEERKQLIFDELDKMDIRKLKYIVIGRESSELG